MHALEKTRSVLDSDAGPTANPRAAATQDSVHRVDDSELANIGEGGVSETKSLQNGTRHAPDSRSMRSSHAYRAHGSNGAGGVQRRPLSIVGALDGHMPAISVVGDASYRSTGGAVQHEPTKREAYRPTCTRAHTSAGLCVPHEHNNGGLHWNLPTIMLTVLSSRKFHRCVCMTYLYLNIRVPRRYLESHGFLRSNMELADMVDRVAQLVLPLSYGIKLAVLYSDMVQ